MNSLCAATWVLNMYNKVDAMNLDPTILITRDEDIDRASRSLKAMSHPLRLKILCILGGKEISVQDIVGKCWHLTEQYFPASGDPARQRHSRLPQDANRSIIVSVTNAPSRLIDE